jgi:hypothetical protein
MLMRIDQNPQGSATATATMREDNPYDRRVLSVRSSNKGSAAARPVLSGLGEGPEESGSSWGNFWATATQGLISTVGVPLLMNEVLPQQNTQVLPPPQTTPMTYPQAGAIPTGQVMNQPSMASKITPWAIGGVAILVVGAIVMMRRK